jgi:nucleotide-binding universal stress UspA family protein
VLVSRFFYIPGYLSELGSITPLAEGTVARLDRLGEMSLAFALVFGAVMIVQALYRGMREHRLAEAAALETVAQAALPASGPAVTEIVPAPVQISPLARFERFLAASDGSEFSAAAVREAISMARKCGAQLNVMSLVATGVEHAALGEALLKQEMDVAQAHLDGIRAQALTAGVACDTHLIHGQAVDREIVELAERLNVDLIVMGRRGRRGLARMMLGHATAQVIGMAHCNVMVIPRAARVEGRHIILATDGSRFADTAAITAVGMASFCKARATVVSVASTGPGPDSRAEAERVVQRVVDHMRGEDIDAEGMVLEGDDRRGGQGARCRPDRDRQSWPHGAGTHPARQHRRTYPERHQLCRAGR